MRRPLSKGNSASSIFLLTFLENRRMERKKAKTMQNTLRHHVRTRSTGFGFWFGYYYARESGGLC